MNIGQLKERIAACPDDTPVVVSAPDHSYRDARAVVTTGLRSRNGWTEDYGEETTPESEYGSRKTVVLIS